MNTYIALFRGINVGGKNILPMKDLVRVLECAGCEDVKTYIQSGNAVFQTNRNKANKLAKVLGQKILESYGFAPHILLLTVSQLEDAVKNNPFKTDSGKALHFFFLDTQPKSPDLDELASVKAKSEAFELLNNVFYLYAPDGIGRSKLAAKVEKCMGVPVTARNWNTVNKLVSMAGL